MLALVSALAYAGVALSGQSLHEEGRADHSLLSILALFGVAFGCYLIAIRVAVRAPQDGPLLGLIVLAAVIFRLTLLASDPIEEIDLYRYLWDGQVSKSGVDPFRYSPAQVLVASPGDALPEDLARLVSLRDGSSVTRGILEHVHFGELTTIYPPTAQAVFALAALVTPGDASLPVRMMVMKAFFVGFDLATLGLAVALLSLAGRPVGWSVAYGWCPLVVKEVANSGHLDALAYFLATLALYLAARVLFPRATGTSSRARATMTAAVCGAVLGLAVGAKLYPVILAPLVFLSPIRRVGLRRTLLPLAAFGVASALVLGPMLPNGRERGESNTTSLPGKDEDAPPVPPMESFSEPREPGQGLSAFLSQWEMNDFLFLLVMENLRPYAQLTPDEKAWFSVVPERSREALVAGVRDRLGIEARRVPFFLTRAVTMLAFGALAAWLAWRASSASDPDEWLGASFLTVAWFWLLQPTANPWYWTWALPLLPFARNRAWFALSGLAFLYYFRFWLTYHFPDTAVLGTRYAGPTFFDYVVTWFEFAPWFAWLALETRRVRAAA
jgi:hypothetical protein